MLKRRCFLTLLAAATVAFAANGAGIYVRVSGVWQQVTDPQVRVSGTWQPVQQGWVKVSGTWQQFYTRAVYDLPAGGSEINAGGGGASITVAINSNGTYTVSGSSSGLLASGNWVMPTSLAPGSYTIRAHLSSGGPITGSTQDTDLALSSGRSWTLTVAASSSNSAGILLTLKDGGGNTVATITCNIDATSA